MLKNGIRVALLLGLCFGAYKLNSVSENYAARDNIAKDAGFKNDAEMKAAAAKGFKDPEEWRRVSVFQAAADAELKRDPVTKMSVNSMTWSKGGFGAVGIVNVTIENSNDFAVKDVGVLCIFSGKSGTELSTVRQTIYDTIAAKSKRTFKEINVGLIDGQSASAGCGIEQARRL